ncbi:4295_t:CDS:2, partial [Cetraspora pellucida]
HQEKFEILFKYRGRNQKKKFKGGLVGDPVIGFPSLTHECYKISFEDIKGKTKYIIFSNTKKGLISMILKLLIKQRKQAKKDHSKYDKSNKVYINELTESHINQEDSENL